MKVYRPVYGQVSKKLQKEEPPGWAATVLLYIIRNFIYK